LNTFRAQRARMFRIFSELGYGTEKCFRVIRINPNTSTRVANFFSRDAVSVRRSDDRESCGEVRRQFAWDRHFTEASALIHQKNISCGKGCNKLITWEWVQESNACNALGAQLYSISSVAISHQYEKNVRLGLIRQPRSICDVLQSLLYADVSGVEYDRRVGPPTKHASRCFAGIRGLRFDVCPVPNSLDGIRCHGQMRLNVVRKPLVNYNYAISRSQQAFFNSSHQVCYGASSSPSLSDSKAVQILHPHRKGHFRKRHLQSQRSYCT